MKRKLSIIILCFIVCFAAKFSVQADVIKQYKDIQSTGNKTSIWYHTISISSTYRLITTCPVYRIDESKWPEFVVLEEITLENRTQIEVLSFELWDGPDGQDMYAFMIGDKKWLIDASNCKEVKNAKNIFITIERYIEEE